MSELNYYHGYDLLEINPHGGPVVTKARFRWRPRFLNRGRSQSHQRKLNRQWEAMGGLFASTLRVVA